MVSYLLSEQVRNRSPPLTFANTLSMIASALAIPLTSTTEKFSLSTVTANLILPNLCGLCPAFEEVCAGATGCLGRDGSMGNPSCLLLCVVSLFTFAPGCPACEFTVRFDEA